MAIAAKDYSKAFFAGHGLRGASENLSFTRLSDSCRDLCEALRSGEPAQDVEPLMDWVFAGYKTVLDAA